MDFNQYLVDKKEEISSHNVKKRYLITGYLIKTEGKGQQKHGV